LHFEPSLPSTNLSFITNTYHSDPESTTTMAGKPFSFGTDIWDPTHRFETSWLLSPWVLFFIRALFVSRKPPSRAHSIAHLQE